MVPVNHGGLSSRARFAVHGDSGDERCLGGYAYRIAKPQVRNALIEHLTNQMLLLSPHDHRTRREQFLNTHTVSTLEPCDLCVFIYVVSLNSRNPRCRWHYPVLQIRSLKL